MFPLSNCGIFSRLTNGNFQFFWFFSYFLEERPSTYPLGTFLPKWAPSGKIFFEKKILPYGRNRAGLMNVKYEARSRHPCLASNAPLRTKSCVGQLFRGFAPLRPHKVFCANGTWKEARGMLQWTAAFHGPFVLIRIQNTKRFPVWTLVISGF